MIGDERAEHLAGCNMVFRKPALEEVGGFDPQFTAAGDDVVVVLSGRVRLTAYGADRREVLLAIRRAGELLGEMAALGGQRRTASVVAVDDVEEIALGEAKVAGVWR